MALFEPDRYFSRISRIDIHADLLDAGLSFVLLDIDNTIRSRATHDVPRDVKFWLSRARNAGVAFCLLSNNFHEDTYDFARQMRMPVVAKAMKPMPFGYMRALDLMGAPRQKTVVVGDQLTTDIVGAHVVGLRAYLVAPLAEQDLAHTRIVRKFESAILGDRAPEGGSGVPVANMQTEEGVRAKGAPSGARQMGVAAHAEGKQI